MVAWRYEIVVHKIFKIWNKINGIKWCRVLRVYIYRIENLKRYYVCEKIYLVNCQNVGWSGKMVSIKISNEYTELKYKGGGKTLLQWCWDFYWIVFVEFKVRKSNVFAFKVRFIQRKRTFNGAHFVSNHLFCHKCSHLSVYVFLSGSM